MTLGKFVAGKCCSISGLTSVTAPSACRWARPHLAPDQRREAVSKLNKKALLTLIMRLRWEGLPAVRAYRVESIAVREEPCAMYLSISFLKAVRHILQTILCVVQ